MTPFLRGITQSIAWSMDMLQQTKKEESKFKRLSFASKDDVGYCSLQNGRRMRLGNVLVNTRLAQSR